MEIKNLVEKHLQNNQPSAWFEELYAQANQNPQQIPWAHLQPNQQLIEWLKNNPIHGKQKPQAVIIGCGLGDDAQAFAEAGYHVTAFDVSPTAINWCKQRFPHSPVDYVTADIFHLPSPWQQKFDLIWECRTIQALPLNVRAQVIKQVVALAKPTAKILVSTHIRTTEEAPNGPPWPLSSGELNQFKQLGWQEKCRSTIHRENNPISIAMIEYQQ
ncbi:class I SAM-dependent methyltransferase [Cyanobacterium stanieri]|nr:class I SAM-dependent methyltransferase [Cyanobacterium stanieri]